MRKDVQMAKVSLPIRSNITTAKDVSDAVNALSISECDELFSALTLRCGPQGNIKTEAGAKEFRDKLLKPPMTVVMVKMMAAYLEDLKR